MLIPTSCAGKAQDLINLGLYVCCRAVKGAGLQNQSERFPGSNPGRRAKETVGGHGGNLGPNGERYGSHGNDCYKSANAYWSVPENRKRLIKLLTINNHKRWKDSGYKEKNARSFKKSI